jgi:trehalose-6-phosphate synthase
MFLGADRLDYTKGFLHRLKAYDELLADGDLDPTEVVMVMVASPSRERVESYMKLRDDVELAVGRINGQYGELGHAPVVYLHHNYPREEMMALYLATDVMLVTPLRDGMNLVAKDSWPRAPTVTASWY